LFRAEEPTRKKHIVTPGSGSRRRPQECRLRLTKGLVEMLKDRVIMDVRNGEYVAAAIEESNLMQNCG
jgi:hypothetical protein